MCCAACFVHSSMLGHSLQVSIPVQTPDCVDSVQKNNADFKVMIRNVFMLLFFFFFKYIQMRAFAQWWLALSPHSKRVLCLNLSLSESSFHVCIRVQRHAGQVNWFCDYLRCRKQKPLDGTLTQDEHQLKSECLLFSTSEKRKGFFLQEPLSESRNERSNFLTFRTA